MSNWMNYRWSHRRISLDTTDWFYRRKKHFCPTCKKRLKFIRVCKKVDPSSKEAYKYGEKFGNAVRIGNRCFSTPFEATWREFYCTFCNRQYPIGVVERENRKKLPTKQPNNLGVILGFVVVLALLLLLIIK